MEKEKKTILSFQRILRIENSKIKEIKLRIAKTSQLIQQSRQDIEKIDETIKNEREISSHDLELKTTLTAFLDRSKSQKGEINKKIIILEQELECFLKELKEASATAKGYEKIIEAKQKIIQVHMDRLEQKNLDEIAIKNWVR